MSRNRNPPTCILCENPASEAYYDGRFKGYRKTCDLHHHKHALGPRNGNYKNGSSAGKDRYERCLDPYKMHLPPNKRSSLTHRVVAAKVLGRQLLKSEIVHHLNGLKRDNRPENLLVIDRASGDYHETWTYVRALQQRIRDLEERLTAVSS